MLVVSDTDDIFLPKPTDLLLNLSECKVGLEALLNQCGLNPATQQSYFRLLQESGLLQAASPFYKTFAIKCSRARTCFCSIRMSLLLVNHGVIFCIEAIIWYWPTSQHACLATHPVLSSFYVAWSEDALKFAHEFGEVLAMPIMLEAVMRVRASRGALYCITWFI